MHERHQASPALYRYLPFALFMAFIGLDELLHFLGEQGLFRLEATTLYYLYPLKALAVGYLLFRFRHRYGELRFRDLTHIPTTLATIGIGLLVFVLWINMDWTFGSAGAPQGYNPLLIPDSTVRIVMILFRVAGAVLVVPLMEELFWRSFLIRYIIDKDFDRVPLGAFTWGSFLVTVALFGLEHSYILAGVMAGVFYNLILYRTKSLAQCVLAHAVTNLALALYVLQSGEWRFW
ncbi:CAAX prenyl protease-related protein [Pelobacter propionicus]|uniref:Abortive infection protein n=1 Tax=Pelobacter propionicus (strain DSM 2379 / NBRC 103807 / OttBd1) TaxID=338966 RepID=A1ARR6_PELPD|nr:CAAX prenyl protease-related protein [Pelobacter propionicus]ABL00037.1 Abortive infection protein [Pelobacter propionicus DSM 2379]